MTFWGWVGCVAAWAVLIAAGIGLTRIGAFGVLLFLFMPMVMGALTERSRPASSFRQAAVQGALAGAIGCFFFLLVGLEGLICVIMSLPVAVPLGLLGSTMSFQARTRGAGAGQAALLLLPFGVGAAGYDVAVTPRVYDVTTAIEIAASPDTVWQHIVSLAEMPPPAEWTFRTGIGYPRQVRTMGTGVGAIRYCDFSTGSFVEPITVWEPGRRLEFDVVDSPAPMREWSPYGDIHPVHLNGYFNSRKGRFVLRALSNGHTLVEGTTWYEHGLEPAGYWRWWSDAIVHRVHRRVLTHIKHLAEA
jgi:hypothetical protein